VVFRQRFTSLLRSRFKWFDHFTRILDKASPVPYWGLTDSGSISVALDIPCLGFDSVGSRPFVTRRCIPQCRSLGLSRSDFAVAFASNESIVTATT
jgi:hypothetical protein